MSQRFFQIARFEALYQLKSPVFLVSFVMFALLAFGGIASDNIQLGSGGNVNVNSPYAIAQNLLIFSVISMFVVVAFVANVVLRDVETRSAEIFYSTPIGKFEYLLGRFSGALLAAFALLLAVPLGLLVGMQMPWLDPELIGPFSLVHYLDPYLAFGLVNLVLVGAVAFALATLTRSMAMTYVVLVGYLMLSGVIGSVVDVFNDPVWRAWLAMLDPFGGEAFTEVTRYWTAIERNENRIPFGGLLLWNRLVWLAVAMALLGLTVRWFRFDVQPRARRRRRGAVNVAANAPVGATGAVRLPEVHAATGARVHWRQLLVRSLFETRTVVFSVPFLVLVLLGVMVTVVNFLQLDQIYQTSVYPVTRVMTQILQATFTLSLLIVVIYYSGELVWREREARLHEVIDATPMPGWVQAASKILALLLVIVTMLVVGIVTSMAFQLSQGWLDLQPDLYITRYLLDYGLLFYAMGVLAIFVQVLAPTKYAGMGVMVLVVISFFVLEPLGFEDPLYRIGDAPAAPYSDMNGYGYFGVIQAWYSAYWLFVCLLLFVGAHLLWRRGGIESLRQRAVHARANFTPGIAALGAVALAGFLTVGGFIVYNTRVFNEFLTSDDIEQLQVEYEQRYADHETLAQPRVVAIDNELALYPSERRWTMNGRYTLENRTDHDIDAVIAGFSPSIEVHAVQLAGSNPDEVDEQFGVYRFELAQPMRSGDALKLEFETEQASRGFKHARNASPSPFGGSARVVGNGSFVYGNEGMPYIGYSRQMILSDRDQRRKHGLPPIDRAPDLNDMKAARNSGFSSFSDWLEFRTTVSTAVDQMAVVPGYLAREWSEDGRRYFEYVMDAPIQYLMAYLSGRYAVERESVDGVDLSVYYHPDHAWNVEHMLETMKKSLDYFQANFSPYQYRQMRILEFPAFMGNFAQSFANTIQWSEGLGFIAKLDNPEDIDYVFYVGAHEMAHQWWGHQVSAADVQGGTALIETLAQYSALMVMEAEYGPDMMRRFLSFELDSYLSARGTEAREELPLIRVENQGYIHYRKGAVVMYALKDYLGEDRVNKALANLIDEVAWQYDPYPRSVDLIRHLKTVAETDDELALIEDLFERITLWDLQVASAASSANDDGSFTVSIDVTASKLEADGEGRESEIALDMPIDIGVFTQRPDADDFTPEAVLHLAKHRVVSGSNRFEITVDQRPSAVGIDPYHKLIDRVKDDNLRSL